MHVWSVRGCASELGTAAPAVRSKVLPLIGPLQCAGAPALTGSCPHLGPRNRSVEQFRPGLLDRATKVEG